MVPPENNDGNPAAPRTQAERTALAETRMVLAAIELLNTAGIQGTTLVAIGEKAGYSRGLATHHFGSKAGLFTTVLRRLSAAWSKELKQKLGDRTGLPAIVTAIDAHLQHALRHPEYIRAQNILWGAALDPSSEFKPNVAEFMQIQRESVACWVEGGKKAGEIKKSVKPSRFAEQFYGGLIGINHQWLVSPDFDLATAYEDFKQSVVRLVSTV
jgi:AcrR family transcriptional regulator